ncbi:hypothetical protein [Endozoicomonas sp. SESOKO1]|uniref:hypothetical protein n=1 Tax=Endozoicomonas sp. SESOKO1 TaxID=2828742 RepID=UPI0021498882|nr:hypothetical protein [Endozoicomonas sp. SESOKO1]
MKAMMIRNIAQYIFQTLYLTITMSFISYLSADQSIVTGPISSTSILKDISAVDYYYQAPAYPNETKKVEFSFKHRKEINEEHISSFIYKTIDNPDRVRNQVAGTAILYGLDSIGLGESVKEGIYIIKKNTRYSFSNCGEVRLKTNRITAGSCLPDGGSVELNSSYNFNAVQLQFKWSI